MLFAGWEVCIVKNCLRPRTAFSIIYLFPSSELKKKLMEKNSPKRYCDGGQRWKIRTALRTNQIVGFVTVLAWKKKIFISPGWLAHDLATLHSFRLFVPRFFALSSKLHCIRVFLFCVCFPISFPGSSLFLPRESTLVAAGHIFTYTNQIHTEGGSLP